MSVYDVEIGKLISGRRDLEGSGTYFLCTPDKRIVEIDSYSSIDGIVVTSQDIEDALYEFGKAAVDDYIAKGNNKDVYTFSIQTDTVHGSCVIYINNLESLNQSVEQARSYDRHTPREQLFQELQYAETDYPFMYYEKMPERLRKWLSVYSCISMEMPQHLDIEHNYIFEQPLFDSQLFLMRMPAYPACAFSYRCIRARLV